MFKVLLSGLILIGTNLTLTNYLQATELHNLDPTIVRVESPADVAGWVVGDLLSLPAEDREHQFYVWIPSWSNDVRWNHTVAFTMNTVVSRSGFIQRPISLANGWLQRWDLRELIPEEGVRNRVVNILKEMIREDPYFHDINDDTIDYLVLEKILPVESSLPEEMMVCRADWFIFMALSSIEGGRYLELRGLADPATGTQTQEAAILSRFGVHEANSESIDADRRVGTGRSGVTGKARAVAALRSFIGLAWLTEDLLDEDVDNTRHPIYQLHPKDFEFRGREIIAEMNNGFHVFLITDADGNILREAPSNLVTDNRVPAPNTARLQGGAISCIRCHGSESGLRSCENQVATILAGPFRVIGDDPFVDDIITRYSGRDFDRTIELGRENYENTIDELTQGEMDVEGISTLISEVYAKYRYDMVDAKQALVELGFDLDASDPFANPVLILREVLAIDASPSGLEDPSIALLLQGKSIRRWDFNRIHPRLAYRSNAIRLLLSENYRVSQ